MIETFADRTRITRVLFSVRNVVDSREMYVVWSARQVITIMPECTYMWGGG